MDYKVAGIFEDSEKAGEAVAELKQNEDINDISVLAKESDDDVTTTQVDENITEGATTGATIGGVLGALTGLLAGASTIFLPGIGTIAIAGPLAASAAGLVGGAATGGLAGALIDLGIPDKEAKEYESMVTDGEVLVLVSTEDDKESTAMDIMKSHGARRYGIMGAE